MKREVAIIGYGALKIGKYPEKSDNELAIESIRLSLEDSGVPKDDVDGLFTTPNYLDRMGLQLSTIAEYMRVSPKSMAEISCGGTAAGLTIKYAMNEILLGNIDIAVCYGTETRRSMIEGYYKGKITNMFEPTTQPHISGGTIWAYACSARRYMHEYHAKEEHFAMAAVRDREAATKNPYAYFRTPITVDDVLNSTILCTPIKLLDSSAARDGAAAVVLASKDKARRFSDAPVYLRAVGEHHDNSLFVPTDRRDKSISSFTATKEAAKDAFKMAKCKSNDIDIAEIYAPFSPQELIIPEDLGFFTRGGMIKAIQDGSTEIGGEIPINTDGGLLSRGHPAMITPFYESISIIRQLRGEAGKNQVEGAEIGLMHCEGGMLNNCMVFIFQRG
ncbi:MAG: thiolase family protein [Candidatus Methanolliviera hydrocarbonicum]|uniref:Thiolase family protein n=1 Tax=Candidatus Methanolliviera hydrocarbonicum TaxID=2491085 RepID=A0A520KVK8_9EURY|nr:MAG: thiolase family protein [Candidatus Methanolliviera hydrocarbonicum]